MPDKAPDKPLYAELVPGAYVLADEARDIYEYLADPRWDKIAAALRKQAESHRNTIWGNIAATMPEIDRARGWTNALEFISELRNSLRESMRNPTHEPE